MLRAYLGESRVELVRLDPQPARTATAVATIAEDGSASYESLVGGACRFDRTAVFKI